MVGHKESRPYFPSQDELLIHDNLLWFQDRIVIPEKLRSEILKTLHNGHYGLKKCQENQGICVVA